MTCRRCIVSGRVQGVFYRAATQHRAQQLGLSGYAINLADGSVDVLVCGEAARIDELVAWLWEGPPAAVVTGVECEEVDTGAGAGFKTA